MRRLNRREFGTVLDCVRSIYATLDLDAFPRQVIASLRRVVRAPFGSYNEIDRGATRIRYVVEPAEATVPHLELTVREYQHEQPVVANYLRTGDGSPRKLSDFLTLQKLHRLGIYNENYRRAGVEYQMTFMVQSLQRQSPPTIAIALDRGRGDADFSEHDRFMLNLLRPHVMTAYANAETVAALRRTAPVAGGAPEARRREIIVLRPSGRHLISPRAAYWFGQYFKDGSARGERLPAELQDWITRQSERVGRGQTLAPPPTPLVVESDHTRLIARLIPDSPNDLLILEEERTKVDYTALQRLGLTPREAEVLHWVGSGKTNPEIGAILRSRPRTVAKHLERIFAKLGVDTRGAAAARTRAPDAARS
jgi:DNA-binding CsgD family transcriptional regulator